MVDELAQDSLGAWGYEVFVQGCGIILGDTVMTEVQRLVARAMLRQ